MEAPIEQHANVSATLHSSHESYQSSTTVMENIEENQAVVCDYPQETVTNNDQCPEDIPRFQDAVINSYNLQETRDTMEVNVESSAKSTLEAVTMSENKLVESQDSGHLSEIIMNDNAPLEEDPQGRSVGVPDMQVTGQVSENDPSEQVRAVERDAQSDEYASEYMLEHHTENVYMPEQAREEINLVSQERAYSPEVISDDSHDNGAYEKVVQPSTGVEGALESVGENFVSEYQTEHENEGKNNSHQAPEKSNDYSQVDENVQETCKVDMPISTNEVKSTTDMEGAGANIVTEIHDQGVNNEIPESDLVIKESSVDESNKGNSAEKSIHEVKEELQSNKRNVVPHEEQQTELVVNQSELAMEQPEIVDQPIEHVIASTEIVENMEMVQAADPLSEDVQTYGISEDLEVTVQDGEYTIVEGPGSVEISANEQDDEHINTDESLGLIENYQNSEDNSLLHLTEEEMYMTELRNQSESRQSTSSQSSENKPRRGRRPTYDIPMHVLGHDISKPVETVSNGRAAPRPRLGVKVPYRNLTSQIVSKAEIEKEIMERARLKQEQASSRGDLLFARKLTQRLARKIAPSPDRPKRVAVTTTKPKDPIVLDQPKHPEPKAPEQREVGSSSSLNSSVIQNDSDLLAILEGEGEEMPVLPKEVPGLQMDESNLKMLEREIALQQLQELPHQTAKQRIFRGRAVVKSDPKAPVLVAEASATSKQKSAEKTASAAKETSSINQPSQPLSNKENTTLKQPTSKEGPSISSRKEQSNIDVSPKRQPIEIEPQVKVNMVLKTYSRKRKTVDLPESLSESPVAKKAMLDESEIKTEKPESTTLADVYVTKSSRIIKKKVIWDPDEIPSRSPKPSPRPEIQTAKIISIKPAKQVDKNSNTEKVAEKKPVTEKVVKEKPVEKKIIEKPLPKKVVHEKAAFPVEKKTPALKSDSPKSVKASLKIKKPRSEVDKLLMDEGAVKMLYDLKNNDETIGRKKKDVYSVEKAHKDILKKANQIKNDLEQNTSNESPKSLRKKEALTPSPVKPAQITALTERKMSKDSTRSSVHTPPGSPAYSFAHSQSSMLVRRRSSSSISSSDDIDANSESRVSKKKSVGSTDTPKPKKVKKSHDVREPVKPEEPAQEPTPKPAKPTTAENKLNQYKSFTVKKSNRHATIDLNYINEKCYCTVQVLEELTAVLKRLSKDKDCNIVTITSSSKAFCLGLDYASLISDKEDVRKNNATELAERVRDFLLCLLNFPKVLVAGIRGECIGLGVTMLPLFDMVIASDAATFSTPYSSLGCIAEAGFLLSSPNLTNHGLAAELLFTTQKLTADDAFRRGLISRLCWPEKYNETLKLLVTSVSKGSKQSLEATKMQLRRHVVQTIEAAIKSDTKLLIEHWMSPECQSNFARVSENGN